MAALVERNGAHGNTDRHRSMVVASSAQTVFGQFHAEAVGGVPELDLPPFRGQFWV
jgi:hypothetical protein